MEGKLCKSEFLFLENSGLCPVVDPGFPVGGVLSHWGALTSDMGTFCKNIWENKRIGSRWGGTRRRRPLDPPMVFTPQPQPKPELSNNTSK